jgi:hypothetical protein
MTEASEAGRALVAHRPLAVFVCEVCGREFEARASERQPARTCSGKCRVKLHRQNAKNAPHGG